MNGTPPVSTESGTSSDASRVRIAWSALDPTAPTLVSSGGVTLAAPNDAKVVASYAPPLSASTALAAIVVSKGVRLVGGRRHVIRMAAVSTGERVAYMSVTVKNEPTRELLPTEGATLPWTGSGLDAMQMYFVPPIDGEYDVYIRFREVVATGVVLALKRILLVELDPRALKEKMWADSVDSERIFADVPLLTNTQRELRSIAFASMLTNEAEARYTTTGVSAAQSFALAIVSRDMSLKLQGRTPCIDLRTVYGSSGERAQLLDRRMRFKVNVLRSDLPRDDYGIALVADPRVDTHYLDAQMHLLLLKFHNRVMDHFCNANAQQGLTALTYEDLFHRARVCVITHWQWIVLFDTVRSIVPRDVFTDVCRYGQRHYTVYDSKDAPAIPPSEFTHAIAHIHYHLRRDRYPLKKLGHYVTEQQARYYVAGVLPSVPVDLTALASPSDCSSGALDSYIPMSAGLAAIPHAGRHAAAPPCLGDDDDGRTAPTLPALIAGNKRISAGYFLAKRMGVMPISEEALVRTDRTGVLRSLGLSSRRLPLLSYVMKEAEIRGSGEQLQGVGARLLVEFARGFIWSADESHCCLKNEWRPTLPRLNDATYTLRDLITWTTRAGS